METNRVCDTILFVCEGQLAQGSCKRLNLVVVLQCWLKIGGKSRVVLGVIIGKGSLTVERGDSSVLLAYGQMQEVLEVACGHFDCCCTFSPLHEELLPVVKLAELISAKKCNTDIVQNRLSVNFLLIWSCLVIFFSSIVPKRK
jgi:hypothetical protein